MSLNFKTVNINSSTYPVLTREQINSVLSPVTIVLIEEEAVVGPSDSGPVTESTGSVTESAGVGGMVRELLQSTLENRFGNIITNNTIVVTDPTGRTPGITAEELLAEVIIDFENRTYGNDGTTRGGGRVVAGGVVGAGISGVSGPTNRFIADRLNGDETQNNDDFNF